MSSARNETPSSNQNWKNAGRKTKRGKPTGRREVVEKYKAMGMDTLDCSNRKQQATRDRVFAYGFNEPSFIAPMFAQERRRANKLALQDQLRSLENEESQEEAEHEAREECDEMMIDIELEPDRELADRLGIPESFFEDPWSPKNIEWHGFLYSDLACYMYGGPHFGEGCFVCKRMAKYGEEGPCQ